MARITGLATVYIRIEGVDYAPVCEDFDVEPENQTEDGSGGNQRWEDHVAVKSRWTATGTLKADDTLASLLAKIVSNDILVTVSWDDGVETFDGNALLTRAGKQFRNGAINMIPFSLQGCGAPIVA